MASSRMMVQMLVVVLTGSCTVKGEHPPAPDPRDMSASVVEIPAQLSADALLAGWEQTYGQLDLARCQESSTEHVLGRRTGASQNGRLFPPTWFHVERISDGTRYHYRQSTSERAFEDVAAIQDYAFDGTVMMGYIGSDGKGLIGGGNLSKDRPGPVGKLLGRLTVISRRGIIPLPSTHRIAFMSLLRDEHGAIRREVQVRPQLETIAGEHCHVLQATYGSATGQDAYEAVTLTLWLAAEKNCLMMRYESAGGPHKAEMTVQEVGQVKTPQGVFWYPAKGTTRRIVGASAALESSEISVHAFNPQPEFRASDFVVQFPQGLHVQDLTRQKTPAGDRHR